MKGSPLIKHLTDKKVAADLDVLHEVEICGPLVDDVIV